MKLKIGMFGFGCVGQGLYHVLNNSKGFKADIVKIGIKDKLKARDLDLKLFSFDKFEILDNPEINVVVELINDPEEAYEIVSYALKKGKHVVTANKKMVASYLPELFQLTQKYNVSLLYEASTCGSIPIIRTIEEYFDNEQIERICGIFNGTTNYILTKIVRDKLSYSEALLQAQDLGFAELDPVNDVEGFDPKYKAIIMGLHAFGVFTSPDNIFNLGITTLSPDDINYANEKGFCIKLIPTIKKLSNNKIAIFVLPKFIDTSNHLYNVDNEFNGVLIDGIFSGQQFLKGKGAGGYPTGAAVLSDISALSYGYKYQYKKLIQNQNVQFTNEIYIKVYCRYNSILDLEKLSFEEVAQQYTGESYNYIIGLISLTVLIDNRSYIIDNKLFISVIGEEVYDIAEHKATNTNTIKEK